MLMAIGSFSCNQKLENEYSNENEKSMLKSGVETEFYYTDKGEKEFLSIREDKVIIKTESAENAKALCKHDVFLSAYDVAYIWVIATIDPKRTKLDDLMQIPEVVNATYALEYADGTIQYPTDLVNVNIKEGKLPEEALGKIGLSKNVESIELIYPDFNGYNITLNVGLSDILQICRDLYESGLCEAASPSFVREMKPHNTYFPLQWGLKNTGQSGGTVGIDIKAEQAWTVTKGSTDIKVAVIDEGVQLDHPDLQANLLPGFDATVGAPGGANGSPYGTNNHGTLCAGIVAAIDNTIGVIGVAPKVKIIPIRIAYIPVGSIYWTTNDPWIANGINHAWNTANADVLSNSWGGGSYNASVINAINSAVTNGRLRPNGTRLGCTVVFSSGNGSSSTVSNPASQANVIAVGAIKRNGNRASFSNYGSALDVVAPGVEIVTTNIGSTYTNSSPVDGTSYACPHVAGIAALLLSNNSNLTQTQVRSYIESGCTKINTSLYSYSSNPSHPYGLWNTEVGHGLVNAVGAFTAAGVSFYTVTFHLNGASGSIPSQSIYSGGYATKPTPDPDRPGYTFGGWYDNSACTGTVVNFATYKITSNKTFYAKWTSTTFTVSFDLNGAPGTPPASQSIASGGKATKPNPNPTWSGSTCTFVDWYENSACTGSAFNFSTPITGNKILYAKWNCPAPVGYVKIVNNTGYQRNGNIQIPGSGFLRGISMGAYSTSPSSGWTSISLTPGTYYTANAIITDPNGNYPMYAYINLDSGTSSSPPQIASWTQAWDGSTQDRSISLNIVNGNTYYFVVTLW